MRQDLLYAIRTLRRSRGFALVTLTTLALGIGATSAIFTIVYSVLLRPLPFKDSSRLISVRSNKFISLSDPDFLAYERAQSIEGLAGYSGSVMALTGLSEPATVLGRAVTSSFWRTLGVAPAFGQTFVENDERVVVLSDHTWRRYFDADRGVLGKAITLDGRNFSVVGVMGPGFDFPQGSDLWLPTRPDPANQNRISLQCFARLRIGFTEDQANAELEAISKTFNSGPLPRSARAVSLYETVIGNARLSLKVFMGAVGFLLLIACVNVANLLVARGTGRTREFATRAALGASRWRLIRQLISESVLLSLGGGLLGFFVGMWGESALVSLAPGRILPRATEIAVDGWVFGFTLALSIVTGIIFGLLPAIQISRTDLHHSMKQPSRTRGALVIAEIALAVIVLAGAGLLIRSFVRLRSVPKGFESRNVLSMKMALAPDRYQTPAQLKEFHRQMTARLAAIPGIEFAAAVNWLPFGDSWTRGDFYAEGQPDKIGHFDVMKPDVSEDYFRTLGIRLLRGRYFTKFDDERSLPVAIIGKSVADRAWPGDDPIGKRLTMEDHPQPKDWLTVVGVIDDVNQGNLHEAPFPTVYQPLAQAERVFFLANIHYVVRTSAESRRIASLLRASLHELDPNQPVQRIALLEELVSRSTAEPRFQSIVIAAFAGFSLLLAAIGIYGMMAYSVAARRREIGIRVALGATPRDVRGLVLSRSAALIAAGLAIGLIGALALTRVLASLLFEVKPTDPLTFVSVGALLAAVGIVAAFFPARTAARLDPVIALRQD